MLPVLLQVCLRAGENVAPLRWQMGKVEVSMKAILMLASLAIFSVKGFGFDSICVKVNDPANLPLPKAHVSAVNLTRSKVVRSDPKASSGPEGLHCFIAAAGDVLKITATLEGFISTTLENVKVIPRVDRKITVVLNFQQGDYDEYKIR